MHKFEDLSSDPELKHVSASLARGQGTVCDPRDPRASGIETVDTQSNGSPN